MQDASTLTWSLTFFGTLGVAFLIFVSQVIAFTLLLGLAAVAQLLTCAARALNPVRRNH